MYRLAIAVLASATLAVPARAAAAPPYPAPGAPPIATAPPARAHHTHTVCRSGCDFRRIQAAVDAARADDTIKVRRGTYREAVTIAGAGKSGLRLIGDRRHPARVTLDGRRRGRPRSSNGVTVQNADHVTVSGLRARHYGANGFLVIGAAGYRLTHLRAARTGDYGLYALNSIGGVMADSESHYTGDSGFYIGQTPRQDAPRRTIVRNVDGWGAPAGFSGTNMRYVTITGSRFYDNAIGILLTASTAERFPPPEDNVISGNEVFWNNFDISQGAPFEPVEGGITLVAPAGTGILLLGGRRNVVAGNRVFGNFLGGVALLEGFLSRDEPAARPLQGNVVRDNEFGLGGADLNGRDLLYDGNGTGNCFAGNVGVAVTVPADGATLAACPFAGANAFSPAVQAQLLSYADANDVPNWIRHPHAPKPGYEPLEVYAP